jgi:hypothetical protein
MAVANVSATYQNAVCPELEGPEDEVRRNTAGTHYTDQPNIRGILKAADAGQIGAGISTPVAAKSNDLGLELRSHCIFSFCVFTLSSSNNHHSVPGLVIIHLSSYKR